MKTPLKSIYFDRFGDFRNAFDELRTGVLAYRVEDFSEFAGLRIVVKLCRIKSGFEQFIRLS